MQTAPRPLQRGGRDYDVSEFSLVETPGGSQRKEGGEGRGGGRGGERRREGRGEEREGREKGGEREGQKLGCQ